MYQTYDWNFYSMLKTINTTETVSYWTQNTTQLKTSLLLPQRVGIVCSCRHWETWWCHCDLSVSDSPRCQGQTLSATPSCSPRPNVSRCCQGNTGQGFHHCSPQTEKQMGVVLLACHCRVHVKLEMLYDLKIKKTVQYLLHSAKYCPTQHFPVS